MDRRRHALLGVVLGFLLSLLAACQPSPEERLSAAEESIAAADYRTAAIELRNLLQAAPDDSRGRLLLAEVSYQLGDFAEAVSQYERAIGLGETDSETWVAFGRALLSQGGAAEALDRVVPNFDSTPPSADEEVFTGDVLLVLGNLDGALEHYDRALAIDANNVLAIIGQASVNSALGNESEAERLLDSAAAIDPRSFPVWQVRGIRHLERREYAEAVEAFSRALELETKRTPLAQSFIVRINLIAALIDMRDLDNAELQLNELRQRVPDHPVAKFLGGRLAFVRGDYEAAQLQLQEYLAANPGDARGRAVLGAVNFSQDNLRQAESNLLAALRANAGGEATRRLLAETRLRLDDPSGALEILRSADPGAQLDSADLFMLGRAQVASGDESAAIESFKDSLARDPDNDVVRLSLASTYLQADMAASAVELLDAMPNRPGSALRRHALLVGALLRQGDRDRAIAESDRMLREKPDDAGARVVAGALWQSLGDSRRANSEFNRALSIEPDNLAAQFSLSRLALADGDSESAVRRLEQLLQAHPAYVPALVSLGMLFQESGRLEALRPYAENARSVAPDVLAPYLVQARLELALGSFDETLRIVESAQSRFPDVPDLDHLRGLALLGKGDVTGAMRSLATAASGDPDNPVHQFDLARAQLENDRPEAARTTAEKFCRLMPEDIRCHVLLGDIDLVLGNGDEALRNFETAETIGWNRPVAIGLARARSMAGKGSAADALGRWVHEHPEDYPVRQMYALALETEGQADAAFSEYEALHAVDKLGAAGLNNLAWQYSQRGDKRALEIAEQAHALAPDNASVADTLGWILVGEGDYERALPLLREAAEQRPDNAEIRNHLDEAERLAARD